MNASNFPNLDLIRQAEVVQDLPELTHKAAGRTAVDGDGEFYANLQVGTLLELRDNLRPQTVPDLGRNSPRETNGPCPVAGRRLRLGFGFVGTGLRPQAWF